MSTPATAATPVHEGLFSVDPPALLSGKCSDCGTRHFPRRAVCPACQATSVEEAALSTTGTVYTFTIVRMSPPGYLGEAPYAVGVVELSDGLRVTATITAAELEAIAIGDPVDFELLTLGDVTSFAFRRREGDR